MGKRHAAAQDQQADQEQRIEDLENQQPPAASAPPPSGGISAESVQRLEELGKLREQGILTDDEFSKQKERLLAG
jgi:hypothetical protein